MSSMSHQPMHWEERMSEQRSGVHQPEAQACSPYGYSFWDRVEREDPGYVKARGPLSELSIGEGRALSIKYQEMVIISILAYCGHRARMARGHPICRGT